MHKILVTVTCVVKQTSNKSAVPEEGVCGGDVLKVALFKHRIFKHHVLHLQVEEPADQTPCMKCSIRRISIFYVISPTHRSYVNPKLLLVIEVVSLAMHLVLQGKVESDVLHPLIGEGLCA